MPYLKRTFVIVLPLLLLIDIQRGRAQTSDDGRPKTVLYNGQNYFVELSPGGAALKITPQGTPVPIGIVDVRRGRVTALDPNNYDTVKGVYDAYKASGSTFAAPAIPSARNALSNIPGANPAPASTERTVTFPAEGGAVVHATPFGDITYNADGTEARAVQRSSNGITGETTMELIARYKGGDSASGGKAGAYAKGVGGALAGALNPRHTGKVDTRGNDEIEVYQRTNGGKETPMFGTGEKTIAVSQYAPREMDAGTKTRAKGFLNAAYEGLQTAMAEAKKRRDVGEAAPFDPSTSAAGQNALREYARFEKQ